MDLKLIILEYIAYKKVIDCGLYIFFNIYSKLQSELYKISYMQNDTYAKVQYL